MIINDMGDDNVLIHILHGTDTELHRSDDLYNKKINILNNVIIYWSRFIINFLFENVVFLCGVGSQKGNGRVKGRRVTCFNVGERNSGVFRLGSNRLRLEVVFDKVAKD